MSREHSVDSRDGFRAEAANDRQRCVIFVGNLPFQTPWQRIKDEFAKVGKVRYCDLVADKQGRPKGSALVTMASPEAATRAVSEFNETEFNGRRIIVREFNDGPRPAIVQRHMMPEYRRRDGRNGNERGNDRPPRNDRGPGPNNSRAPAASAVPKPRSAQVSENPMCKLFVSNLPFDCNATALRDTFAQVGVVRRAEIITGRTGKSRGMGIVVMDTSTIAQEAINEFHGIEMAGRAMHVRLDNGSGHD